MSCDQTLKKKGSTYRLDQERKILEFLENQGISFVPRSIRYDENKEIHITSYVGEQDIGLEEMDQELLEEWSRNSYRYID